MSSELFGVPVPLSPSAVPVSVPSSLKLRPQFDVALLQADLARIVAEDFVPHFNTRYYDGDWSVVSLRAVGGDEKKIYPDPTRTDYADTPLMARCPYIAQVVDSFPCPKLAVRFLRVRPRSVVKEHRDYNLRLEDGELRLHIPITTNPEVRFMVAGKRVIMAPGECWYNDFTQPHSVHNDGDGDRVHLTIDCVVNDWLREQILTAGASAASAPVVA